MYGTLAASWRFSAPQGADGATPPFVATRWMLIVSADVPEPLFDFAAGIPGLDLADDEAAVRGLPRRAGVVLPEGAAGAVGQRRLGRPERPFVRAVGLLRALVDLDAGGKSLEVRALAGRRPEGGGHFRGGERRSRGAGREDPQQENVKDG